MSEEVKEAAVVSQEMVERLASQPLEYKGQRVITLDMMDKMHQRKEGHAGRMFRKNKDNLDLGSDYYESPYLEWSQWFSEADFYSGSGLPVPRALGGQGARELVLLTMPGYLMLVRTFKDKAAWKVQRVLVDYFMGKLQAGQPVKTEQPIQYRPWSERISKSVKDHACYIATHMPDGFSILTASYMWWLITEDILLEHLLPLKKTDLPDGSASSYWRRYRKEQGWPEVKRFAPLEVPHREKPIQVKVYPGEERPKFESWFIQMYLPNYAPKYLRDKFEAMGFGCMPGLSAADNTCRQITGRRAAIEPALLGLIDQAPGRVIRAQPLLPGFEKPLEIH